MTKYFFVFSLLAALTVPAGNRLEIDFRKQESVRLFDGAEIQNGYLILKGGRSRAEIVGSEKFKVGKNGLTVSCAANFDPHTRLGQDLFWKADSWMLSRFDNGSMNAYLHDGKNYVSRTDAGKAAEPGTWKYYTLVIRPIVLPDEGKSGYALEIYINGELEARTENFGYRLNEPAGPVTLGRGAAGDVWNMRGKIACFSLDDRALTQDEILKRMQKCKLVKAGGNQLKPIEKTLFQALDALPRSLPERQWIIGAVRRAAANGADQKSLTQAVRAAAKISAKTLEEFAEKWNAAQKTVVLIIGKRAALFYVVRNSGTAFPLCGMLDRKSGREVFGIRTMDFQLKTSVGKKKSGYSAARSKWEKSVSVSGNRAVMTFKNQAAVVTLTQKFDGNARLESHIRVQMTDPKQLLHEVVFPNTAFAAMKQGTDRMFYPYMDGVIADNPTVRNHPRIRQNMYYPRSYLSMQFGAYYDEKSGIYFAFEDPDAEIKQYYAQGRRGDLVAAWTGFAPWKVGSKGGNSYDMSGTSVIELYDGDWYEASRIYRKFLAAKAKWWIKDIPRKDTPEWFRNLPGWVQVEYNRPESVFRKTPKELAAELKAFRDYLELPFGIHLYNWDDPRKNTWPHFFPRDSIAGFLKDMKEKPDIYIKPYIDSRLWAVKDGGAGEYDYMFSSHGKKFAVKNPDGSMNYEHYHFTSIPNSKKIPFAIMCPGAEGWQKFMVGMATRVLGYGFPALYHDEIAAARPYNCFDPDHGHLLNDPKVWVAGHRKFMSEIRRKNPGTGHDCEDGAEAFIDMLDGLMVWRWYGLDPVFMSIYHGRIQFTGRQYNFSYCNPKHYRQFFVKAAVQLTAAEQIGWFPIYNLRQYDNHRLFAKKTFHLRNMLLDYFNDGEMLPPLKYSKHPGWDKCDWGSRHRDSGPEVVTSRVIAGAFKRNNGIAVVILVNPYGETVSFEPDLRRYKMKTAAVCGEKGHLEGPVLSLPAESAAVMILADDPQDPAVRKEVARIEKYMLRIGKFTPGLSPENAAKLKMIKTGTAFDPLQSVPFGKATVIVNANHSADGTFAGWLRKNPMFAFQPVKAVKGKYKCRLRVYGITGQGSVKLLQGGRELAAFKIAEGMEETESPSAFSLLPGEAVIFRGTGNWQGKMLDWQLIPAGKIITADKKEAPQK